jgi:hypothetical protein
VENTGYLIAVEAGLLLGLLVAAGWTLYFRIPRRTRRTFRNAARALGGRLDPASESARFPAILVEFDGLLVRAVLWPLDLDEEQATQPPFLEVCTPVDGIPTPVRSVRQSDEACVLPLLRKRRGESWPDTNKACESTGVNARPAAWAEYVIASHPTWSVVELDRGRLRILARPHAAEHFDTKAVTHEVLEFANTLPAVASAAGLPQLSRVHGPWHGPAIH